MSANGTTARRRPRAQPRKVGGKEQVQKVEATPEAFMAAIAAARTLADEASKIRSDATELTPELFNRLWPLLRREIPAGFLVEATRGEGKPYDSMGIRSVQVCVDRMDDVFTPLWWDQEVEYLDDGKLCKVTVIVHVAGNDVRRTAWGGVNRGSTTGNLYKGSYTNAGKRAFALLGIGHEIYIGATDFDPDVDPQAAREQARTGNEAAADQDIDPRELELRTEALACAKEILDRGVWTKQRLKAEFVGAKAQDASSASSAISTMPRDELEKFVGRLTDLLPPPAETGATS